MSSERQLLEEKTPWWGEHVHRYKEVFKFIKEDDIILDLACGTGFGSALLAEQVKGEVIGGDISADVIRENNDKFNIPNLSFKILDGTRLQFPDSFFSKIVSFETIEHTTEYYKMINEFKRVLKPNGVAFISTPNFIINSPSGKIINPYHTQEFTYEQFLSTLNNIFTRWEILGQKYNRYERMSFQNFVGSIVENFLYFRGIRKIPIGFQDKIMNILIGKQMYPLDTDYILTQVKSEILKCKTFFAICYKD